MKEFVKFLTENWKLVLEAFLLVASVLIWLFKKKPVKVVDTLKEVICRLLPSLICLGEKTSLKGSDKMQYVLDELVKILKELNYGDDVIAQYLPFAAEQVEVILSTPQKKGVK